MMCSQEAFADRCGFARSYMSRIERGAGNPSLDAIETLATALEVDAQELFKPVNSTSIKKPISVPFAADGTCFHPDLVRPRSSRYQVGIRGDEHQFEHFEDALNYLRKMDVAYWRRPNTSGSWGIVKAVHWDELPGS